MFFLFNDRLIIVPTEVPSLKGLAITPEQATNMPVNVAIATIQRAFIRNPHLMADEPETSEAGAWLLAVRSNINAALFIPRPKAKYLADVPFRIATVSAITLGKLSVASSQDRLTAAMINQAVWLSAA
jgi:hypothetical protein